MSRNSNIEITYALTAPHLAGDLADVIASFELVDRVADAVLAADLPPIGAISALAAATSPAARRTELLKVGAAQARDAGLRESEMDFLFALAADPAQRGAELLLRLERLTRDTGRAALHPEVLGWLAFAATQSASLVPLVLRRQAETKARAGAHDEAEALVLEAMHIAKERGDATARALCLSTRGAIALYRADWAKAELSLAEARTALGTAMGDPEERARLEHNFGVVALYRDHPREARDAFTRSLAVKRTLGDRAGVRACLLNLGITLAKLGLFDEAEVTLQEATALAETLGQTAGRGWCLAARADVEIRRKNAVAAERFIAEAEGLGEALPSSVRADLAVLRALSNLLEGDGALALQALSSLDPALRASDALVDSRALVAEARAHLSILPANRRRAARLAVLAIRRSRAARLPEAEEEAKMSLPQRAPSPGQFAPPSAIVRRA